MTKTLTQALDSSQKPQISLIGFRVLLKGGAGVFCPAVSDVSCQDISKMLGVENNITDL
jgi:hypothetical protein